MTTSKNTKTIKLVYKYRNHRNSNQQTSVTKIFSWCGFYGSAFVVRCDK